MDLLYLNVQTSGDVTLTVVFPSECINVGVDHTRREVPDRLSENSNPVNRSIHLISPSNDPQPQNAKTLVICAD